MLPPSSPALAGSNPRPARRLAYLTPPPSPLPTALLPSHPLVPPAPLPTHRGVKRPRPRSSSPCQSPPGSPNLSVRLVSRLRLTTTSTGFSPAGPSASIALPTQTNSPSTRARSPSLTSLSISLSTLAPTIAPVSSALSSSAASTPLPAAKRLRRLTFTSSDDSDDEDVPRFHFTPTGSGLAVGLGTRGRMASPVSRIGPSPLHQAFRPKSPRRSNSPPDFASHSTRASLPYPGNDVNDKSDKLTGALPGRGESSSPKPADSPDPNTCEVLAITVLSKARARMLGLVKEENEGTGTEVEKLFALGYGRGLGMGKVGMRRGSGLSRAGGEGSEVGVGIGMVEKAEVRGYSAVGNGVLGESSEKKRSRDDGEEMEVDRMD